jgi:transposase
LAPRRRHQPPARHNTRHRPDHRLGDRCGRTRLVTVPLGRQFAAWLGLTPRPHSSGGWERLGGISKQGDGYLGKLLVVGATAVMRMARKDPSGSRGSHSFSSASR